MSELQGVHASWNIDCVTVSSQTQTHNFPASSCLELTPSTSQASIFLPCVVLPNPPTPRRLPTIEQHQPSTDSVTLSPRATQTSPRFTTHSAPALEAPLIPSHHRSPAQQHTLLQSNAMSSSITPSADTVESSASHTSNIPADSQLTHIIAEECQLASRPSDRRQAENFNVHAPSLASGANAHTSRESSRTEVENNALHPVHEGQAIEVTNVLSQLTTVLNSHSRESDGEQRPLRVVQKLLEHAKLVRLLIAV